MSRPVTLGLFLCLFSLPLFSQTSGEESSPSLFAAVNYGNVELLDHLLIQKADLRVQNAQGRPILVFLLRFADYRESYNRLYLPDRETAAVQLEKLLQAGADPLQKGSDGLDAVTVALNTYLIDDPLVQILRSHVEESIWNDHVLGVKEEWARQDRQEMLESLGLSLLWVGVPLGYLGASIGAREFRYKSDSLNNPLVPFHSVLGTTVGAGLLSAGIVLSVTTVLFAGTLNDASGHGRLGASLGFPGLLALGGALGFLGGAVYGLVKGLDPAVRQAYHDHPALYYSLPAGLVAAGTLGLIITLSY